MVSHLFFLNFYETALPLTKPVSNYFINSPTTHLDKNYIEQERVALQK